ncbi:hypothetical protein AHiyo8_47100 [Arthrobacter sp. Hiyo8]|nr:hypothetical protein AHiyo8_47100 [Arthrobacter sp. Hiyo8]
MLLLLAELVDFRHGCPRILNLNGDPAPPAQMEKTVDAQIDTGLFTVRSIR